MSDLFDMTNISMAIVVDHDDYHQNRTNVNPLDPEFKIALSAVYSMEPWGPCTSLSSLLFDIANTTINNKELICMREAPKKKTF